ncbi:MAG TPA: branched-chain-amino-acid transaminase [Candidatus Xenobia bacterium]|jgi:branched-chain amino acid aminotransferase
MSVQVFIDGAFYGKEEAKISVWDHGFLYGDGVFEGIRVYGGRIFRLEQHLRRMYDSARIIQLDTGYKTDEMTRIMIDCCRRNEIVDGYIRAVISRGKGDLGLNPRKCKKPTVVIIADKIQLYSPEAYEKGMKIIISATRKNAPESLNPRIKSLNYLNNILAKIEANDAGAQEAVMLNSDGYVTECTSENIFVYQHGVLRTPPAHVGILEGITRGVVLEIARDLGIPTQEALLNTHDLFVADECFVTGTGAEMLPVVEVNGRRVGTGKPGDMCRRLLAAFRDRTRMEGTPVYNVSPLEAPIAKGT